MYKRIRWLLIVRTSNNSENFCHKFSRRKSVNYSGNNFCNIQLSPNRNLPPVVMALLLIAQAGKILVRRQRKLQTPHPGISSPRSPPSPEESSDFIFRGNLLRKVSEISRRNARRDTASKIPTWQTTAREIWRFSVANTLRTSLPGRRSFLELLKLDYGTASALPSRTKFIYTW